MAAPTAYAASNSPVLIGKEIQLTGSSDQEIVEWLWVGVNGFTSDLQNPTLVATANAQGNYTLTVTNADDESGSVTIQVLVSEKPDKNFIYALDFGYISGRDLARFCPVQHLITQYLTDEESLSMAVRYAYSEVISKLSNKYDIESELQKTTDKSNDLIKLCSLFAVRNIFGNTNAISENQQRQIEWADMLVKDIRSGQAKLFGVALPQIDDKGDSNLSKPFLVESKFKTLG